MKEIEKFDEGINSFTLTKVVPNKERHHAILQALFRRLKDPELASFVHAGPSLPMTIKLHQDIHRELNTILRDEGFLRPNVPGNEITRAEFKEVLQAINEFYAQKAAQYPTNMSYSQLRDTVSTFINTLENAGLL